MISIYEKYAQVLINYSLQLKKNDKFMIRSTPNAAQLVKYCCREAILAGAYPETYFSVSGIGKMLLDYGTEEQLKYLSPTAMFFVDNFDVFLNINAPYSLKSLQRVDPQKIKIANESNAPVTERFFERTKNGELRWCGCEFPSYAQAQECGMGLDDYEKFLLKSCYIFEDDPVAKWEELHNHQQKIVDYLNNCENIQYQGKDIDVKFSCKGRTWVNCDGKMNMPDGEVFTSPVEDSVNGKIRFSYPGIFMGNEIEDILLEIKDGQVVKWKAEKGQKLLDQIMDIPGTRRFGEAAIGTNYQINEFTKNMLFDEKIGGTIHMALGRSLPDSGGENKSTIHWDLLADMREDSEIIADSEVIYKNGEFLIGD